MDSGPKFTFSLLSDFYQPGFGDIKIQDLLKKWGNNFMIQKFSFNEPFHYCDKHHLAEAFFRDPVVSGHLKTWSCKLFKNEHLTSSSVDVESIPCSVTSLNFFDKLSDPVNKIVYPSGALRQTYAEDFEGIPVYDHLRIMILDESSPEYSLYSTDERNEFIFQLFQLLVLGGEFCQYEDYLDPYLQATKALYRDLVRIQKDDHDDLIIRTIIIKVVAKNENAYFPKNPLHKQNAAFLLIDPITREITTLLHQYN